MSDRTGLGLVEAAVLSALRRAQPRPDATYTKCARVVNLAVEAGIGPRWAYEALCLLGRTNATPVGLIDFHGNCGSKDFDPAPPEFTEARLSPTGVLALAAEEGALPPLPLGLIIGDTYLDGRRPPFDALRMTRAVSALVEDPSIGDGQLIDLVGPPVFPGGCEIGGDLDALITGDPCVLELTCRMALNADGSRLELTNLPPSIGAHELEYRLGPAGESGGGDQGWPYKPEALVGIAEVSNRSQGDTERVVCAIKPGADVERLRTQLRRRWGVSTRVPAQLPAPLPALLRTWVDEHRHESLVKSLGKLRIALAHGNPPPASWIGWMSWRNDQ
ncbi:MAG: hypothetical protein ABR511_11930 [Acidimicrobiales bacterium]